MRYLSRVWTKNKLLGKFIEILEKFQKTFKEIRRNPLF